MSGWDFDLPKSGGGDKAEFAKFPEGITFVKVIDDAPHMRWTHWFPKAKRSINCPGKGCPICEIRKQEKANGIKQSSHNMQRKLSINVINRSTNRVEILDQGTTFFEDMRDLVTDLKEQGKKLIDVDLKVRRRGTGKDDTSYRIDIEGDTPLTDADKKLMESKVNFEEYFKPHTSEQILRLLNGEEWAEVMKSESQTSTQDSTDEDIEVK